MNKMTREAILRELKAARDIAEVAEKADRDLTGDERAKVQGHITKAGELKARGQLETDLHQQITDLSDGIGLKAPDGGDGPGKPAGYQQPQGVSLGEAFTKSDEYTTMLKGFPNGRPAEQQGVRMSPLGVKDLLTVTGGGSSGPGTMVWPDWRGMLDPFYQRPLKIRQLLSNATTASDTVEYVRLVSTTNNAAPVPEAASAAAIGDGTGGTATTTTGGVKPESAMTFERDSTTVKTLAHWLPITKRTLSDAGQIRALIDQFLLYGLELELEGQVMAGDGTGENLLGLAHVSGVQTQAAPSTGQDAFTVTRKAWTKVRIGGRTNPTAYVMHPTDWEGVELLRSTQGLFYAGGPFSMAQPSLWGLPVVVSEATPVGTAWLGAWNFAVLYNREQSSIQATDAHADFFIRNLVAILAEMRVAFACLRPQAFVKIALA